MLIEQFGLPFNRKVDKRFGDAWVSSQVVWSVECTSCYFYRFGLVKRYCGIWALEETVINFETLLRGGYAWGWIILSDCFITGNWWQRSDTVDNCGNSSQPKTANCFCFFAPWLKTHSWYTREMAISCCVKSSVQKLRTLTDWARSSRTHVHGSWTHILGLWTHSLLAVWVPGLSTTFFLEGSPFHA